MMAACSSRSRNGCLAGRRTTVPTQAPAITRPTTAAVVGRMAAKAKTAANRAWEATAKASWAARMFAAIATRRATRPMSAVRRRGMRRPKSTWPRVKRRSKVFSWPMTSSSPLLLVRTLHQCPKRAATSTSKNRRCSPISEKLRKVTGVDGFLIPMSMGS
jgi:hypothetical protein